MILLYAGVQMDLPFYLVQRGQKYLLRLRRQWHSLHLIYKGVN